MAAYYPAAITTVEPRSVAAEAGLCVGDVLLAINQTPTRDIIDVQILSSEPELTFLVERAGQRVEHHVARRYGVPLGLGFEQPLFDDKLRVCRNRCEFCFVAQMAPGLRSPLYIRDDDYRLSFLHGNYITLTNLSEADWNRIEDQFLSPLYVSVHATEPELRADLMQNPVAAEVMDQLTRLTTMGIEVHTQAVLVPGRNDGEHLDRTIADLSALYPGVVDLSVVPVGLTRWHKGNLHPYTDEEAATVLNRILDWQTRLRDRLDTGFIYPSDEWFLRAGAVIPTLDAYDGLLPALIENGVGMVRLFLSGWDALESTLMEIGGAHQTWVTGTLFAPILRERAAVFAERTAIPVDVLPVVNHTFGETVTVAGLLTVTDILKALGTTVPGDVIVLPEEIFRGPDGLALDDRSPQDLARATGCKVFTVAQHGMAQWFVQIFTD